MVLIATDLPEPVVPATKAWGILPKSATIGAPAMSLPIAKVSKDFALTNTGDTSNSRNVTISRSRFGISKPTTVFPGIISTIRTLVTDKALAKSLDKVQIRLTLTPAAGCNSKRVITGPG